MSLVASILANVDDILSIRDEIGAVKKEVYMLSRVWTGLEIGSGTPTDTKIRILPSPYVYELKHDLRIRETGNIKEGDIIIKMISKKKYPQESMLDLNVNNKNEEKFYYVGGKIYSLVSILEEYVYWNLHLRKTHKQDVYFAN